MARPVPRNIDRPERLPEFIVTWLAVYYSLMFITGFLAGPGGYNALIAFTAACFAVYIVYRITLDKPEGMMFRLFYRYFPLGKMVPSPARVKIFEVN